ncbi:MAG: ATP synthase subunit I [Acidobacteria bacterium]|nr:ATP synthase subunit I [Acidobacteriota bacterium]
MGEDLEPITAVPVISHRGILIIMAVVVALASVCGFVFGGTRFGFGVIFGGVLSFANYIWLDRTTKAMFAPDARYVGDLSGQVHFSVRRDRRHFASCLLPGQCLSRRSSSGSRLLLWQ